MGDVFLDNIDWDNPKVLEVLIREYHKRHNEHEKENSTFEETTNKAIADIQKSVEEIEKSVKEFGIFLKGDLYKKGFINRVEAHLEQAIDRDKKYEERKKFWKWAKASFFIGALINILILVLITILEIHK